MKTIDITGLRQVAILSLGSPCLFSFYPRSGTEASSRAEPGPGKPQGWRVQLHVFVGEETPKIAHRPIGDVLEHLNVVEYMRFLMLRSD